MYHFFSRIYGKKNGGRGKGREILQIIKRQTLAINQTDRDAFEILHEFQPLRFIQNRQNLNPMLQCTAKDCAGLCACSCFIYLHFSTGTGEIFFNRVNIVGNWRCQIEKVVKHQQRGRIKKKIKSRRRFRANRFRSNQVRVKSKSLKTHCQYALVISQDSYSTLETTFSYVIDYKSTSTL